MGERPQAIRSERRVKDMRRDLGGQVAEQRKDLVKGLMAGAGCKGQKPKQGVCGGV